VPFALYETGEILYHLGRVDDAVAAFKLVSAFRGDYDVRRGHVVARHTSLPSLVSRRYGARG
jgi:hypothetical protein